MSADSVNACYYVVENNENLNLYFTLEDTPSAVFVVRNLQDEEEHLVYKISNYLKSGLVSQFLDNVEAERIDKIDLDITVFNFNKCKDSKQCAQQLFIALADQDIMILFERALGDSAFKTTYRSWGGNESLFNPTRDVAHMINVIQEALFCAIQA